MRGRDDGSLMWYYGGRGEGYEFPDGITTTEDLTEFSDPVRNPPAYTTYRVPRVYGPAQYYYPVKKQSKSRQGIRCSHRCSNFDKVPVVSKHSRTPLLYRRSSRALPKPRRRSGFTISEPSHYQQPKVMGNKKLFIYSGPLMTESDEGRQHAKAFWRKTKKGPTCRKMVSYCREAVDSSTSADGKSVRSTYSRLSVDVSDEMAAMHRDIETILSRYESAFDQTLLNEIEERGNAKKRVKSEVKVKNMTPLHGLKPEQVALLAMEKPPVDRLGDIPFKYLKPRPPRKNSDVLMSEQTKEAHSGLNEDETWKSMLQDLISQKIMGKNDGTMSTELQSTLKQATKEKVLSSTNMTTHPGTGDPCMSSPFLAETMVLSEIDKNIEEALEQSSVAAVNNLPVASKLPNLVERSEEFIPINRLDDEINWKRKLEEVREVSQNSCTKCQTLAAQLKVFNCGSSGDTILGNTASRKGLARETETKIKLSPSGDQSNICQKATHFMEDLKGSVSNLTVNTALTNQTVKPTSYKGDSSTAGDSQCTNSTTTEVKAGIGVKVDDVGNEEDVPLMRKNESISIVSGQHPIKGVFRKRQHTAPTHQPPEDTGYSMYVDGGGDSLGLPAGFTCVPDQLKNEKQDTNELNNVLAELDRIITRDAAQLNTKACCHLIKALTNLMQLSEPIRTEQSRKVIHSEFFWDVRQHHLSHIIRGISHIEFLDDFYRNILKIEGFQIKVPKSPATSAEHEGPDVISSQRISSQHR